MMRGNMNGHLCLATLAATEFKEIFSGTQPRQNLKMFRD